MLARVSGQFDATGVFATLNAIMMLAFCLNAMVWFAATTLIPW